MTDHPPQPSRASSATPQYVVSLSRPLGSETPRHPPFYRDSGETTAETGGLKALARVVLARDTRRDRNRDRVSRQPPEIETPSETVSSGETANSDGERSPASWSEAEAGTAPATVIAPVQWFGAQSAADEPPYDQPCPVRCGVIRYPQGRFEHFCAVCGAWGGFGYGAIGKEPGRWYCFAHRPASEPRIRARSRESRPMKLLKPSPPL